MVIPFERQNNVTNRTTTERVTRSILQFVSDSDVLWWHDTIPDNSGANIYNRIHNTLNYKTLWLITQNVTGNYLWRGRSRGYFVLAGGISILY